VHGRRLGQSISRYRASLDWTVYVCSSVDLINTPLCGVDPTKIVVDLFGYFSSKSSKYFYFILGLHLIVQILKKSTAGYQSTTVRHQWAYFCCCVGTYHVQYVILLNCFWGPLFQCFLVYIRRYRFFSGDLALQQGFTVTPGQTKGGRRNSNTAKLLINAPPAFIRRTRASEPPASVTRRL